MSLAGPFHTGRTVNAMRALRFTRAPNGLDRGGVPLVLSEVEASPPMANPRGQTRVSVLLPPVSVGVHPNGFYLKGGQPAPQKAGSCLPDHSKPHVDRQEPFGFAQDRCLSY